MFFTNQCTNFVSQDGEKFIQNFLPVGKKTQDRKQNLFQS